MDKHKPKESRPGEMELPREFAYRLRELQLHQEPHLLLNNEIETKIKQYVRWNDRVKLTKDKYHMYFGDIKVLFNSFIRCWTVLIDETIKEADRWAHTATRNDLLQLLDHTIELQQAKQCDFSKEFLPAKTDAERKIYETLEERFKWYLEELYVLRERIDKLDKLEKVRKFTRKHFNKVVHFESEAYGFTHLFLAIKITEHFYEIRLSLEEILLRITKERNKICSEDEQNVNKMMNELYDMNRKQWEICRLEHRRSTDLAEIEKAIDVLRAKISENKYEAALARIDEEINHWKSKIQMFDALEADYKELQNHLENVTKQERIWLSKKALKQCTEKHECMEAIGENYREKKKVLQSKLNKAALALMSYFTLRGADRVQYEDEIGTYTICDYGHQVYHFDHYLTDYHLTCDGDKHKESDSITPYYFDENGRYILGPNKEKVYQYAPCGSTYKLGEDGTFEKTSADCGHSEHVKNDCKMKISYTGPREVLPLCQPVDIKGTLDSETVKYLWDTFGAILPDALHDVEAARPVNPIHLLAHKILYHKYSRSRKEFEKKQEEAQNYRASVENNMKEQAQVKAKAWKSKQVKREVLAKTEDVPDWHAINSYERQNAFIRSLDHYN